MAVGSATTHQMQKKTKATASTSLTQTDSTIRLFISGHSLTDQPIPDQLAAIASSLGTEIDWDRQYIVGSSILMRSKGSNISAPDWPGYRAGLNRNAPEGNPVSDFRNPRTILDRSYDALLITEQNGVLSSLTWQNTVRYLRHYHDRLIEGNPRATTYFYESWIGLNDKSDPRRWIAYERKASPIWQCIATRINLSLEAKGRTDRIVSLPAGNALAELVESAISTPGVPGISLASTRETVNSIIKDDVHLTELGSYYMALVSYSTITGKAPLKAWHPATITESQANSLQKTAWDFVSKYAITNVPLTLDECRIVLRTSFLDDYWGYVRDSIWRREGNPVFAYFRWARYLLKWHWLIRQNSPDNPFYFNGQADPSSQSPGH